MGHVASWGLWACWALLSLIVSWRVWQEFWLGYRRRFAYTLGIATIIALVLYVTILTFPLDDYYGTRPSLEILSALIVWYPVLASASLYWICVPPPQQPSSTIAVGDR